MYLLKNFTYTRKNSDTCKNHTYAYILERRSFLQKKKNVTQMCTKQKTRTSVNTNRVQQYLKGYLER